MMAFRDDENWSIKNIPSQLIKGFFLVLSINRANRRFRLHIKKLIIPSHGVRNIIYTWYGRRYDKYETYKNTDT